jgi:predicted HTH domain antitoxin
MSQFSTAAFGQMECYYGEKEPEMSEAVIEIKIPSPLLRYGIDREEAQRRTTEWLVLSLFTEQRISSGKAARLLSISRVEFLTLLRARGIAYVDYSEDELNEEFAAADALPDENNL